MKTKMRKEETTKIIQFQVLPKPVFAVYKEEDGSEFFLPIELVVLIEAETGDRWLQYAAIDEDGIYDEDLREASNFLRFEREKPEGKKK